VSSEDGVSISVEETPRANRGRGVTNRWTPGRDNCIVLGREWFRRAPTENCPLLYGDQARFLAQRPLVFSISSLLSRFSNQILF